MSHKCEHGRDSDVCVQCWEEKNTPDRVLSQPTEDIPTPETDAFTSKVKLSKGERVLDAFNKSSLREFARSLERRLYLSNKEIERLKNEFSKYMIQNPSKEELDSRL